MPPAKKTSRTPPPIVVIYGDEDFQKAKILHAVLDRLLPPEVDRAMALCEYDGTQGEEQGGPALATVMDDLATLPFLAKRRVVVIRDADKFITTHRQRLERYFDAPAPTSTLVLVCRSFPKSTRLYKAATACGYLRECKRLNHRGLIDFVIGAFAEQGKQLDPAAAARLVDLVGTDQGMLSGEVEKLCLYVGDRSRVTTDDVAELVGLSREEKVFAVMDAAALGRPARALELWHQVISSDPAATFKAVGGIAFKLRSYLNAHQLVGEGLPVRTVAPKVMMWGRERELQSILRRLPIGRLERTLAGLADLDAQAKVGSRSIEHGVEALLLRIGTQVAQGPAPPK